MAEQQSSNYTAPNSLRALLATPKGNLAHAKGEAFLLHVFWVAPSSSAAHELLAGLRHCAAATHRDTPCVPTYFFHVSYNDADLCPPPPRTVGEHPQLCDARKKLQVGVPPPAVRAHLSKLGLDPSLLDLDPSTELPAAMQQQPVAVEFTEVYLDERSFMEHAGSKDYLEGYGVVMRPALQARQPRTVRLGSPAPNIVEKILDPMLHEIVEPVPEGCAVWRPAAAAAAAAEGGVDATAGGGGSATATAAAAAAVYLSLDVESFACTAGGERTSNAAAAAADVAAALPEGLKQQCTTCVAFTHPLRPGTTRLLCVLPTLPPASVLKAVADALQPVRGEAHVSAEGTGAVGAVRSALQAAGLDKVVVNATQAVGYVLHALAAQVHDE